MGHINFEEFLNRNGVESEYFVDLVKREDRINLNSLNYKITRNGKLIPLDPVNYLYETIDWFETDHSYDFWNNLNSEWIKLIKNVDSIVFGFETFMNNNANYLEILTGKVHTLNKEDRKKLMDKSNLTAREMVSLLKSLFDETGLEYKVSHENDFSNFDKYVLTINEICFVTIIDTYFKYEFSITGETLEDRNCDFASFIGFIYKNIRSFLYDHQSQEGIFNKNTQTFNYKLIKNMNILYEIYRNFNDDYRTKVLVSTMNLKFKL